MTMEPPSDLIVDGATEYEVLLGLDHGRLKMAELVGPVHPRDMILGFHPKPMWSNPKLAKRDLESTHPMTVRVR